MKPSLVVETVLLMLMLMLMPLVGDASAAATIVSSVRNTSLSTATTNGRALAPSTLWVDYETWDEYVHFTDEMKDLLDREFQTLMRGPEITIFTRVPEPPQMVWPLLKGITVRNHIENKILWTHPIYYIQDGLAIRCREQLEDGTTVPVESTLCQEHCTHQGRYCAPLQPAELPTYLQGRGKEVVMEALRRLCFDGYYHASDRKFFDYIQVFDQSQCFEAENITDCALSIIANIDHCEYSNFATCVGDDAEVNSDVVNAKLEAQLAEAKKKNVGLADLPFMTIGHEKYEGPWDVASILQAYCNLFEDQNMHPISCDICLKCQDVRRCLWKLECDGTPFDPVPFLASYEGQGAETTTNLSTASTPGTQAVPVATLPPGGIATSATTSTTDVSARPTSQQGEADRQVILTFFVLSIVLSALTAGFFVYRARRTRHIVAEIAAEYRNGDGYRDGESYTDLELSPTTGSQPPLNAFLHY